MTNKSNRYRMEKALEKIIRCCDATNGGLLNDTMDLVIRDIRKHAVNGLKPVINKPIKIEHVKNLKL